MSTSSRRDAIIDRVLRARLGGPTVDVPAPTPDCLDAELLAAWADGSLPAAEIDGVEDHLGGCGYCQSVLAAFVAAEPAATTSPAVLPFWRRPVIQWIAPLAAAAAVLLVWIAVRRTQPPPENRVASAEQPLLVPVPDAPKLVLPKAPPEPVITAPPPVRTTPQPAPEVAPRAAVAAPPPPPPPAPLIPPPATVARPMAQQRMGGVVGGVAGGITATAAQAPLQVVSEFGPPAPAEERMTATGGAGGGRGVAGGRGGGGARAAAANRPSAIVADRWRILASGDVERSTTGGATWESVPIDPPSFITVGAAPGGAVCWLAGRDGAVLLAVDGQHFERLPFPEAIRLSSIQATDARQATVTTSDGRVFTTTDAGKTWK